MARARSFAFVDDITEITANFAEFRPEIAIDRVLEEMPPGYYNTDLGHSLEEFNKNFLDTVDHRTTLILVGDGRNNYNDPRTDLFRNLARRSRGTIWLNPEAVALWGTGDSDMVKYAPLCHRTFQVQNLGQLAAAVDHLLLHH